MENLYFLLELCIDPPENDIAKIDAALEKKKNQWAIDVNNPVKKTKALGYIEKQDEIARIMHDPALRKKEAEEAKKLKKSKKTELETKLKLLRAKGDKLSPKDLKSILKQFSAFGYTEKEIQQIFDSLKGGRKEAFDPKSVISSSQANQIVTLMKSIDMVDKTLYDLLELPPTASCSQLVDKAETMKKKILAKGDKTAKDGAIQQLCGICTVIFKDEEGKRKYDNYVNLTKYSLVNTSIDDLAKTSGNKITPEMKDSLIDIAVTQYKLSVSDASVYINNYCAYKGYSLPGNKIICGLCGSENPAGTTHCVKCGKALIIVCPSCGSENSNSAKTCAKCGFDLTSMDKAVELISKAKQMYYEKNLDEAASLLNQAKTFWPNHPDIIALEKSLEEDRRTLSETIAKISEDIKAKRMYAAKTKIEQAKAKGLKIDSSMSDKVDIVLKEVERKLSEMRAASGDAAFAIALDLSGIIADSDELNRSLANFPPEPCKNFRVEQNEDTLFFSWEGSSSAGEITNILVRKEGGFPNSPDDGEKVYTGSALSYNDTDAPKNKALYYSIFADRLGVPSIACCLSNIVAIVEKPTDIRAVGGDHMVTLSWTKPSTVNEIRLGICRSSQRPQSDSAYNAVNCPRLDGITINDLDNGEIYWFSVIAGHNISGKTYYSAPSYVSTVPQKPAKPLQDFHVNYTDNVFLAQWERSEWDVILFYSDTKPEYSIGSIYDLEDFLKQYKKVDINLKSATEAEFHLTFNGECYIIPGVINASNVILNEAVYVSSVPCVKDITFDLNSSATEMYVNFTWPKRVDRSTLVYRMDKYPTSIDDPEAIKIDCSKRQYEANEGILISNPVKGTYYAEVFTYFDTGEKRIYSDGVRALLSNEPLRTVYYSFKYTKPNFLKKHSKLTLTIEGDGKFVFPTFLIASKYKSVPLKRGDGDTIYSSSEPIEINRTFSVDIPSDVPLREGTKIKMFFLNDKNYKSFKIVCKAGNTIE